MPAAIDEARLRRRLEELAQIGRTPEGGVTRLSYRPEHAAAVRLAAGWMREAGAAAAVDFWGNLHGLVPGAEAGLPPVAAGSHLDTVPNGGVFDGALGVVAAIEAAQALRDAAIRLARPLLLLGFAEEEGTSFGVGCLGSLGVVGRAPAPEAIHDRQGVTVAALLRAFDPGIARAPLSPAMSAYLELHIEQGPVLAARGAGLAAVEAIVGIARAGFTFRGQANHAGTTPMEVRRDALWGAADLVAQVRTLARDTGGRAVATVGRLGVSPGATNVIPGAAEMTVEVRSAEPPLLASLRAAIEQAGRTCAGRYGLELDIGDWRVEPPLPLDAGVHASIVEAATDLGWPITTMPSWAGHDAKILSARVPAGMIFVPSDRGISHSPEERTSWEDAARGAQVLCRAVERLAA
ncbi:MAG TPA: Zn-dependent hydrolase [bacterium]|nr:Zn-dependent hydrolase [bacterium]